MATEEGQTADWFSKCRELEERCGRLEGRLQDLACAVSDVLWGGELGWAHYDAEGKDGIKVMIAELRRRHIKRSEDTPCAALADENEKKEI